MPSLPLRIAILECDTPFPNAKKTYGGFGGIFEALMVSAVTTHSHPLASKVNPEDLDISKFDVVNKQEYPDLNNVDGILITGSKHNSFDDEPWILKLVEFVKKVMDRDSVRLVGICFGHQITARALGAKVGRSPKGWELSVTDVKLSEAGKKLFEQDHLSLFQMHKDEVYEAPPGVDVWGHTELCQIHGMWKEGKLLTLQGHPEYNGTIVSEVLDERLKAGIFSQEQYEEAKSRVYDTHDGVVVGAEILRFFLDQDPVHPQVDEVHAPPKMPEHKVHPALDDDLN